MSQKADKFFIYAPAKRGRNKGKRLLGVNATYEGGTANLTLQDLAEFLKAKNIELSAVVLPLSFITYAKA